MKKISLVLIIIVISLSVVSFAESTEDHNDITGVWYPEWVLFNGEKINAGNLGYVDSIEFYNDGTVIWHNKDDEQRAAWYEENGAIIVDGQKIQIIDDRLVMNLGEIAMYFSRNRAIPSIPKAIKADNEAQFCGCWTISQVGSKGIVVPVGIAPESMKVDMSLCIDLGKASLHMAINGVSSFDLKLKTDYVENGLALEVIDMPSSATITFSLVHLTDDGGIVTTLYVNDRYNEESFTAYMEKEPYISRINMNNKATERISKDEYEIACDSISEGLIIVKKNGLCGYADTAGNIIIPLNGRKLSRLLME